MLRCRYQRRQALHFRGNKARGIPLEIAVYRYRGLPLYNSLHLYISYDAYPDRATHPEIVDEAKEPV